jgi:hypothetical protein
MESGSQLVELSGIGLHLSVDQSSDGRFRDHSPDETVISLDLDEEMQAQSSYVTSLRRPPACLRQNPVSTADRFDSCQTLPMATPSYAPDDSSFFTASLKWDDRLTSMVQFPPEECSSKNKRKLEEMVSQSRAAKLPRLGSNPPIHYQMSRYLRYLQPQEQICLNLRLRREDMETVDGQTQADPSSSTCSVSPALTSGCARINSNGSSAVPKGLLLSREELNPRPGALRPCMVSYLADTEDPPFLCARSVPIALEHGNEMRPAETSNALLPFTGEDSTTATKSASSISISSGLEKAESMAARLASICNVLELGELERQEQALQDLRELSKHHR